MAPRKRAAPNDSSSEDEINVDKMIETKNELHNIRKEREAKRSQLQKDLDKKINSLCQRIKQTIEMHTEQLGNLEKQQVERLKLAVEAWDRIDQTIRNKLADLQREGKSLAAVLASGYDYRMEKARSLVTPVSEQKPTQDEARLVKKVKMGTSSS